MGDMASKVRAMQQTFSETGENSFMLNNSILVVEDDIDLREEVRDYLHGEGHHIVEAGSLREAFEILQRESIHAMVLDVGLPDGNALNALPDLRALINGPIVMMTAWGQLQQRLQGLNNGADYYLVKPVALTELAAVLARLVPRHALHSAWGADAEACRLISPQGQALQLTLSEWLFVQALREAAGELVAREQLVLALNHEPASYDSRRMDSLVQRLRSKALAEGLGVLPIHTRHGQGFMWLESRA